MKTLFITRLTFDLQTCYIAIPKPIAATTNPTAAGTANPCATARTFPALVAVTAAIVDAVADAAFPAADELEATCSFVPSVVALKQGI